MRQIDFVKCDIFKYCYQKRCDHIIYFSHNKRPNFEENLIKIDLTGFFVSILVFFFFNWVYFSIFKLLAGLRKAKLWPLVTVAVMYVLSSAESMCVCVTVTEYCAAGLFNNVNRVRISLINCCVYKRQIWQDIYSIPCHDVLVLNIKCVYFLSHMIM